MKERGTLNRLLEPILERAGPGFRGSPEQAHWLVTQFLARVASEAKKSGRVELFRFGVFRWSATKARNIRSPRSKELVKIGPTHRLAFRCSKHHKTKAMPRGSVR